MIDGRRMERRVEAVGRFDDPVFSLSADWRFTYCNDPAGEYLAADPESLLDRVIWDRFPETRETAMPEEFHRAVRSGESRSFEVYHRPRDAWLSVAAYPDADGDGLTALMREVTDRKRRERELRRRAAIVRAAEEPMFALDADGRFVEVNDALVDLVGRDRDALLGAHVTEVVDGSDLVDGERRLREAIERGDSSGAFEVTVEADRRGRRRCLATAAVVSSGAGFEGTAWVLRDVTDREARRRRLVVLDRVLRHNLRNDLNKVLCRADVLRDELEEPSLAATADGIAETTRDLLSTSDRVRRFADAIDPDMGERRPRPVAERVEGVVESVRRRHPDATIRLRIRANARASVHESTFSAVEELVENATVHVPDPTVEVTVDATGSPGDGAVRIAVADDGPGIPESERRALVDGEETALNHASGLGLWLVNWAVEKAGGSLSFEERDDWGSVVVVELPRAAPD